MSDLAAPGWPGARALPVIVAYALVAIVGATAATVSAYYLWRLAVATGEPDWLAWSLPVTLDAGAAGGTILWVAGPARVRVWARGIALSALAGTLVGNALSHLIAVGVVPVSPVLVVAIGVTSPAMAAALAHLAHLAVLAHQPATDASERLGVSADASAEAAGAASVMDQPDSPSPVDASRDASRIDQPPVPAADEALSDSSIRSVESSIASAPAAPRRRRSTPELRRRWIGAQLDEGRVVTGGQVERRYGSRNGAREVAQVLASREASAATGQAVA